MVLLTIPSSYLTGPKTRSGSVRVGKRNGNFPLSPSNGRHFPGGCSRACFVLRFSCYLFRSCSSPPPMSVPFCTSQSLTTGARETTRCRTCILIQAGWTEQMMYRVEENLVTFWHQFLLQFPASKQILERLNGANALTFCHGTFMKLFSWRLLSRFFCPLLFVLLISFLFVTATDVRSLLYITHRR